MENIKFEDLPMAMENTIERLSTIEEQLNQLMDNFQPKEPVELMTRKEVAEYFKIDTSTLWNWTKKKRLISYGIGARVYYKRTEIEDALVKMI